MNKSSAAAISACAALALGLMAGCSSGDDTASGDPTTSSAAASDPTSDAAATTPAADLSGDVTMWIYPVIPDEATHKQFWADQVATFQKTYPNVNVKVEIYPWANRDDSLSTAIAAGKGPDVVYLIPDQLAKYASSIEPVDAYLAGEHKADILPNVADSITMDGSMMGSPILTSSNTLMCDKAAFDAIGETEYPATWDDLLALAPKFKEQGIYVTQYWGSAESPLNMTFYPLLWQAGGDVFSEDGSQVAFNSEAGVAALTFLQKLAEGGYVEPDLLTTNKNIEQTAIAQNKVACTWQSAPADVEPYWGNENIVIVDPLKDVDQVAYGTVGSLSMLKDSKNLEAAGAWVDFATSADTVKAYDLAAKYFSPLVSTGALYADDPIYGAIEKTIKYSTVGPLNVKSREVQGELSPQIQDALVNGTDPQQALDTAAEAAQSLLG